MSKRKNYFFTQKKKMTTSKFWFGIITNENNMSGIYRRLLDFKNTTYTIVGKLRDNDDKMVMIKFVMIFDREVDFAEITNGKYKDVFNTIFAIDERKTKEYIEIVKQITFIQNGVDPETKSLIDDERYYSSDDSEYCDSDPEEDDEEDDDEDDEGLDDDEKTDYSLLFFYSVIATLLAVNYLPKQEIIVKIEEFLATI